MGSVIRFAVILLVVVSCGRYDYSAPRNLNDACAIVTERPHYMRAMRATETKWGIPVPVQMAIIHAESRFIGDARTPFQYALGVIPLGRQSSAFGYAQALDGTWSDYVSETGNRRASRDNFADAADFIGWYTHKTLQRNGISKSDARNQYLAYHEGHTGYARGSHNAKTWLIRVADNVADRAVMYDAQLRTCRI